jgi:hypothetical protein
MRGWVVRTEELAGMTPIGRAGGAGVGRDIGSRRLEAAATC